MQSLRRLSQRPRLPAATAFCRPKLTAPAGLVGSDIVERHARTKTELSKGQHLLQYWQDLLGNVDRTDGLNSNRHQAKIEWKTEEVRDLLHTAIRVRQGRLSGVLPEQLMFTFVQVYQKAMNSEDHLRLFQLLCQDFGVQGKLMTLPQDCYYRSDQSATPTALAHHDVEADVNKAIDSWKQAATRGGEAILRSAETLQQASQPLYNNLFLPFSNQPNGIKFLVDMRADVRRAVKQCPAAAGSLRALDRSLRQSLATWFSVGLLQLQPISWDTSSASLLERVMLYEAVHPIQGWPDLHQRLGPMRRVHAFMHPSMPQEPLVILHCALQRGAATSMSDIIHPPQMQLGRSAVVSPQEQTSEATTTEVTEARQANTAVFYSISSTQKGLAGIDLGNFLIKQVAQRVLTEFPNIETLITLSPIPGFRNWLHTQVEAERTALRQGNGLERLTSSVLTDQEVLHVSNSPSASASMANRLHALDQLSALIEQQNTSEEQHPNSNMQQADNTPLQAWKTVLMRLCARYLLHVRRRRLAFDPVANFHLRNGASVWRLNWAADLSYNGLMASFGIMVNYRYVLKDVHTNNQMYLMDSKVPASTDVQQMADVQQTL